MKNILFIFVFIIVLCNCDENDSDKEKYFNPSNLSQLSLNNLASFWDNDTIKNISAYFDFSADYLDGVNLSSNKKGIAVNVFSTKEKAVEAMEERINLLSSIISEGGSNGTFEDKWWYSKGINCYIFLNKYNTIIEVQYDKYQTYAENEPTIIETVLEISKRVDSLSSNI